MAYFTFGEDKIEKSKMWESRSPIDMTTNQKQFSKFLSFH